MSDAFAGPPADARAPQTPAALRARAVPTMQGRDVACLSEGKKDSALWLVCLQVSSRTACEMSDSEDDGVPRLSSHTLAALQEFYAEQEQHAGPGVGDKGSAGAIEENWVSGSFHSRREVPVWARSGPGPAGVCPTAAQRCHLPLGSRPLWGADAESSPWEF